MKIKMFSLLSTFMLLIFVSGCRKSGKPDISGIKVETDILRFDQDFYALEGLEDPRPKALELQQKYGDLFDYYLLVCLEVPLPSDTNFNNVIKAFFQNESNELHLQKSKTVFGDITSWKKEIETAFRYYRYYFPEQKLPTVFFYFYGYNNRLISGDSLLGIAVDQYLGEDFEGYAIMEQYRRFYQNTRFLLPDFICGLGMSAFPMEKPSSNLMEQILYEGKLLYFMEKLLPDTKPYDLIRFTKADEAFCKANELNIWTYLVTNKLLYSNDSRVIRKYTGEAPFSPGMPPETPGRVAVWTGWQIVKAYMKRNPSLSLSDLMQEKNLQKIMDQSKYKP